MLQTNHNRKPITFVTKYIPLTLTLDFFPSVYCCSSCWLGPPSPPAKRKKDSLDKRSPQGAGLANYPNPFLPLWFCTYQLLQAIAPDFGLVYIKAKKLTGLALSCAGARARLSRIFSSAGHRAHSASRLCPLVREL